MGFGFKIKICSSTLVLLGISVIIIEGNYWAILSKFVPVLIRYFFWALLMVLPLVAFPKIKRYKAFIPWFLYIVLVIINNKGFTNGDYRNTYRIILAWMCVITGSLTTEWVKSFPKLIVVIGIPNVLATTLFYFSKGMYERYVSWAYDSYQSGTGSGVYGYRAALADHYSQNATYISMVLIAMYVLFLVKKEKKKNARFSHVLIFVLMLLSVFALLLTTKRAHFMFSVATLILIYFIIRPEQILTRTFKIAIVAVVCLICGTIAIEAVPALAVLFDRIHLTGSDNSSLVRIAMWQYAWKGFLEKPLLGHGWFSYNYDSVITSVLTDATTGCHNIYLQMLFERGIVGITVFLFAAITSLICTIKDIRFSHLTSDFYNKVALTVSLGIQLFCLMYGLTGNMLYDRTFNFYIVAVSVGFTYYVSNKVGVSKLSV